MSIEKRKEHSERVHSDLTILLISQNENINDFQTTTRRRSISISQEIRLNSMKNLQKILKLHKNAYA